MKQAQLLTILAYGLAAWWYAVPYLRRQTLSDAVSSLLWVHVFRYVVLYLYVAKQEGYAISDTAQAQLVIGDLTGAALGLAALLALRLRLRVGLILSWGVIVATVVDALTGFYQRSIEPPRPDATGVWWMIFVFFAPAILVSLPLLAWQLVTRRHETLAGVSAHPDRR